MILYEFEGKQLLSQSGINVPQNQLLTSKDEQTTIPPPFVLKAQVLSGKRAQAGGIIVVEEGLDPKSRVQALFETMINDEKVEKILIEEKIDSEIEYYLSISYDTDSRSPVLTVSREGGTGIEERGGKTFLINPLDRQIAQNISDIPKPVLDNLINCFFDNDCLLLEINPLVKTSKGEWMALDAKIKLDDNATTRHEDWSASWRIAERGVPGHSATLNEIEAKKIDQGDYRGVAGSTYFDLDGDIAILASGGGASITAMDALIKLGGKPANYTEYSGNPPKEKVEKLAKIVLSKPNLHGLWIVGAIANFTDIYETLSGIIEALKTLNLPSDFPIVIRRGGPRDQEAFEMLKSQKGLDLHLFGQETSITQSAQEMVKLAKTYAITT